MLFEGGSVSVQNFSETPIRKCVVDMIIKHHFDKTSSYPTLLQVHVPKETYLACKINLVQQVVFHITILGPPGADHLGFKASEQGLNVISNTCWHLTVR